MISRIKGNPIKGGMTILNKRSLDPEAKHQLSTVRRRRVLECPPPKTTSQRGMPSFHVLSVRKG